MSNKREKKLPLVSVLLPFYNSENYLKEAVDSILKQTYTNFELILINDGSSDDSVKVVESYQDNRIRFINRSINKGLIYTLNEGFDLCKGKYIARMDADDIALPQRLKKQVEFLNDNPDYVVVGSKCEYFGESNNTSEIYTSNDDIQLAMLFESPMIHPSVMIRTEVLKKYNIKFRKDLLHIEDWGMWFDLSKYGKFKNLQQVLLKYRLEGQNISVKNFHSLEDRSKKFYKYMLKCLYKEVDDELIHVHWILNKCQIKKNDISTILEKLPLMKEQLIELGYSRKSVQKFMNQKLNKIFYRIADFDKIKAFVFMFKTKQFSLRKCYYLIRS